MTSPDGALHNIYFNPQTAPTESPASEALEAAIASPGSTDLTASAVESDHASLHYTSEHTTAITSEQVKEANAISSTAADHFPEGDNNLADAATDSDDGSWQRIDTPLGTDDDMTTELRLAQAGRFLTTVATRLTAAGGLDCAATIQSSATTVEKASEPVAEKTALASSTVTGVTADESFENAPEGVVESNQQSSNETMDAHHVAQLAAEGPAETSLLSMAANTLIDNVTGDDTASIDAVPEGSLPIRDVPQNSSADVTDPTHPYLLVTAIGNKSAKTSSSTSSPSKTTPLSVSAPEFVPFGPVRPPGLTITAAADEFVPSACNPVDTPALHHRGPRRRYIPAEGNSSLFDRCKTPDKGVGLFATSKIPIGTRIICEEPLLKIPRNDIALTLAAYYQLPQRKKQVYDSLHPFAPKNINFEEEIRSKVGKIDEKKVFADHLRILHIFAANDFVLANQSALGVFENASRINHSCIPNVHFSNNGELNSKETVHAARDIEKGEELLANYIGGECNYQRTEVRQARLFKYYGFQCKCEACSGLVPESDTRRESLALIVWGLNEYKYHDQYTRLQHGDHPYYPASRVAALAQAEDAYRILLLEGLVTTELCRACRFVSDFALGVGQYEKALHYAFTELKIERHIFGKEVGDIKALGLAAEQWVAFVQDRMDEDRVSMPGPKFWAVWPEKKAMWYDLRKDQKKRAANEKERVAEEEMQELVSREERELEVQRKMEKYQKKKVQKAAKKLREIEAQKATDQDKTQKDMTETAKEVEMEKTQGCEENKENCEEGEIIAERETPNEASG